jgi:metallo-beta-lactamase family protein
VGFMAQHTLGRRLQERRSSVKVFGIERAVHAEIVVLEGLSAHADAGDLVRFARATARAGQLQRVVLVHGESDEREGLARRLSEGAQLHADLPKRGTRIEL